MAFLAPLAMSVLPQLLGKIFNFKDGGMVKGGKIGKPHLAVVHTGERVLTVKQNKIYEKTKSKAPASKPRKVKGQKKK